MKKIFITGFLKNVAISSNTVYNLIGNFDMEKYQINFQETDGTDVMICLFPNIIRITRTNHTMKMTMQFSLEDSSCTYDASGMVLQIHMKTLQLDKSDHDFYIKYQIEDQDECEYYLKWEAEDEFQGNETNNKTRN